jgi:hypothetical protein
LKYQKEWSENNKEKRRKTAREWARKDRLNNPEKYKLKNKSESVRNAKKKYYAKNKAKCNAAAVRRAKERIKTDECYRLQAILRSRIHGAFRYKLSKKAKKSFELLGCTAEEAKKYLEKQFKDDMTWDNHGIVWEIDHVKPISSFDLSKEPEQKKAFHYTNMQPLYKLENRIKGSRVMI